MFLIEQDMTINTISQYNVKGSKKVFEKTVSKLIL